MDIVPGFDTALWEDVALPGWDEAHAPFARHGVPHPEADPTLVRYFEDLLALAESYHLETGRHLNVYGDIGEFFCAITLGMKLHRNHAQGSDGRRGNDFIEVKTIAPFNRTDRVHVKMSGNFSHLFVVRICGEFTISGRMIDRNRLRPRACGIFTIKWADLPPTLP